mgnify:CR=1 FL=1|tara:strand:- start:263 stop:364 length:102 start_codon:yes stop_codon:yes gene_type:complete
MEAILFMFGIICGMAMTVGMFIVIESKNDMGQR